MPTIAPSTPPSSGPNIAPAVWAAWSVPTAGPMSRRGVVAVIAASAATETPPSPPMMPRSATTWIGDVAIAIRPIPMPMQTTDRSSIALWPNRSPIEVQSGPVRAVIRGAMLIASPSQSPDPAASEPVTSRSKPGRNGMMTIKPTEARKQATLIAIRLRRRSAAAPVAPRPSENAETIRTMRREPAPENRPTKKGQSSRS